MELAVSDSSRVAGEPAGIYGGLASLTAYCLVCGRSGISPDKSGCIHLAGPQGAANLAGSHLGVAVGVGRVAVAKPAASVYS